MREVVIVGAGQLGGLIAHALARLDAARAVRIVDDNAQIAKGKAYDIAQAAAIEGFATVVTGSTELSGVSGAGVIVLADAATGGEWQGDEGLALIRRLRATAPRAVLLCAGLSHRELIEQSVQSQRISRARIIGSAGEALVAAATALVGLELDVSPRDVSLFVLGVPPRRIVVGWEAAAVAGSPLTALIREPVRRRLGERIAALWPLAPYALAAAASKAVQSIAGTSRRPVTCFVASDDEGGTRTRTAALPVRLGPDGVVDVVTPRLSAAERVALDNAMLL
jgi:malate dehydrogenase